VRTAFLLAWRTLLRGRFLPILFASAALVAAFVPSLVRTDGSAAGAREMYIRAVPGCIVVILAMAVMCAACGHVARAREENRLALAVVRPTAAFCEMLGIWLAYVVASALVLSATALFVYFNVPGGAIPCRHHIPPVMPSPMIAARAELAKYLADPSLPEAIRKAPRSAVLNLLASKEMDRFDTIPSKGSAEWMFPAKWAASANLFMRARFATQFDLRSSLCGEFSFGVSRAVITNNTQSVLDVPLVAGSRDASLNGSGLQAAVFRNTGKETVMLRPRRDLFLLAPADSFAANLVRAMVQTLSGIALAAAFGLFLSSALSRPVSIFTALVLAAVIFMAPSVIEQYPGELDIALADRIGLMLSRAVYHLTSPLSDASPIADLAEDRCVEWAQLGKAILINAVVLPAFFLSVAAFVVRHKALPDRS